MAFIKGKTKKSVFAIEVIATYIRKVFFDCIRTEYESKDKGRKGLANEDINSFGN